MIKTIFILLGIFIISIVAVSAMFNSDGRLGNETFDGASLSDNWTQMSGDSDCTVTGGMLHCLNQRIAFYKRLPNVSINTNNFSCEWDMSVVNVANGYTITHHWADNTSATGKQVYQINYQNGNFNLRRAFDGDLIAIPDVQHDSTWHQWKIIFLTNYSLQVYINGTYKEQSKAYPLTGAQGGVPTVFEFSLYDADDEAYIDNWTCYNGTEYPASTIPYIPPDFNLTVVDYNDNISINNFTATITNGSVTITNSTQSGHIVFPPITSGTFNITVFNANDSGGYLNRTFSNIDVSSALEAKIYQVELHINASAAVIGTGITNFWIDYNGTFNKSNSSGYTVVYLKAGKINFTGNATGYLNYSINVSYNAKFKGYNTLYFGTSLLTIRAVTIGGGTIQSFKVNLSANYYDYNISKTTDTYSIKFYLTNDTYTAVFTAEDYAHTKVNITFNQTNYHPNYTYTIYTQNSFNITIKDEQTGDIIKEELFNLEMISNISSVSPLNYTVNGTMFVDLITPSLWLFRFSAASYSERHYYFNLLNGTHNILNLWAINSSLVTDVTATIIDETNTRVEGAFVEVQRYLLSDNSYSTREIYKTDVEGEVQLNIIQNDEFYKFIIEYPFGTVRKITEPTYIFDNSIEMQILLGEEIAENFYNSQDIIYTITFNNNTNAFTFTYNDPNNLVTDGCLKIYKFSSRENTLVNSSCTSASSASIVLKVANITGASYEAKGFVGFSPTTYYIGSEIYTYLDSAADKIGNLGLLLVAFLTILFAFVGFWSVPVMVIMIPLPILFASLAHLIAVPFYAALALEVIAIIIIYIISDRA